jgi:hypothetical protein
MSSFESFNSRALRWTVSNYVAVVGPAELILEYLPAL